MQYIYIYVTKKKKLLSSNNFSLVQKINLYLMYFERENKIKCSHIIYQK